MLEPTLLLFLWSTHDCTGGPCPAAGESLCSLEEETFASVSYRYTSDFYFFVAGTHTLNLKLSIGLAKRQTHEPSVPLTPRHILDLQLPPLSTSTLGQGCALGGDQRQYIADSTSSQPAIGVDTGNPAQKEASLSP